MRNSNGQSTLLPAEITMLLEEKLTHGKSIRSLRKGQTIAIEERQAKAVYFVAAGQVKITVVSGSGKEAVLTVLGPQECFCEGFTAQAPGPTKRATALVPATLLRVEWAAMLHAVQDHSELRKRLVRAFVLRNVATGEDVCDQLLNQSEIRLARALLKLIPTRDHEIRRDAQIPALPHKTLAEMVGTTRTRVNRFMVKFKRMGLIDYGTAHRNSSLTVRTGLLCDRILNNDALIDDSNP